MSQPAQEPLIAWPGWEHLLKAFVLYALVTAWFGIVFGGANWLAAYHASRIRIHLDAELRIPLVPGFTVIYMSIYLLFLSAPFVLRTRGEITALAINQILAISFAGIGFLLIPASLAYPPPENLGIWEGLFRFADWLNLDYNLVPSLHIALSVVCLEMYARHATCTVKVLLHGWGLLIAASTVLTHQHHLLDAVMGCLLGIIVVRRDRFTRTSPANGGAPCAH